MDNEQIEEAGRLHGIDAANEIAGCVAVDAIELPESERPSVIANPRICKKCGAEIWVKGDPGNDYECCDC